MVNGTKLYDLSRLPLSHVKMYVSGRDTSILLPKLLLNSEPWAKFY